MRSPGRSMWLDELDPTPPPRPPLGGDADVDVAIVGAGYTGLWTAYYLSRLDPSLKVMVIEREHVGFGASGRNGGWAVGELAASVEAYAKLSDLDTAVRQARAVFDAVDEVGRVATAESIDCGYAKGGTVYMARNGPQHRRQIEEIEHQHSLGFTENEFRLLDKADTEAIVGATRIRGGVFFGATAAVDPARLVVGLANAAEARGVTIVERTAATQIGPGEVITDRGTVTAEVVVQATEAYTRDLEGQRRRLVPLYSRMVATEPLPDEIFDQIGLADRPTFADARYMVIYGQRTEDNRVAFGGRGVPYLFGSKIDPSAESDRGSHDLIIETLHDLFPAVRSFEITHRWGGVLGVPRNWVPFVRYDKPTGVAAAGGYVGEGVAAANLAGRTLADLITETESERTHLPWVGARSRQWEPEPLRWLAIRGSRRILARADSIENRTDRDARVAAWLSRLVRG